MITSLLVCAALGATSDVELLHFTAPWCHACKESEPAVQRLERDGFPIQHINIDQRPDLARQFNVQTIPCFILVSSGRPVGRIDRSVRYSDLVGLVRSHRPRGASGPGSQPAAASRSIEANANTRPDTERRPRAQANLSSQGAARRRSRGSSDPAQAAVAATVRLKVEDPQGLSYGTGTIVDVHGEEALVLTCGHIFRDSNGRGKITVDLFAPGAREPVRGKVLRYDLNNDLALVAIRPGVAIEPAKVAAVSRITRGDAVFSVGCNHGSEATVMRGKVNAIDRYLGPPSNIVVSGQPVDGRSGGGLFNRQGELVGVCQAADPEYNEGVYGYLPTIHEYLDKANLAFVYQPTKAPDTAIAQQDRPASRQRGEARGDETLSPIARRDPRVAPASQQLAANGSEDDTEVVCIVRSKSSPNRPSQVIVLDNPSAGFLKTLRTEQSSASPRQLTELRIGRKPVARQRR